VKKTKVIAGSAMMTALSTVLMLLGSVMELGMYAVPMSVGLIHIPFGKKYGRKYQAMVFAAVSLLSFMLVPSIEQNLMYAGFFGWYPLVRQLLERFKNPLKLILKLIIFNAAIIAVEAAVMLLFVPETIGKWLLIALLAVGNLCFILYDRLMPKFEYYLKRLEKII